MAGYRDADRRWLYAACVAGAYVVVLTTLFTLQLGAGLSFPIVVVVAAPPLIYAALSLLLLREASLARRLSWIGGACMAHLVLAALASVEVMWAGGLPVMAALAQVFRRFAPAPALTLLATPIVLWLLAPSPSQPTTRPEPLPPRRSTVASSPRARSAPRGPRIDRGNVAATSAESTFRPGEASRSAAHAREAPQRTPPASDLPRSGPPVAGFAASPRPSTPLAAPVVVPTPEISASLPRAERSAQVPPSPPMESLPPVPPPVEPVTPAWPPSPQVDRFVASLVHGGAFHASVAPVDGMPFVQLVEHGLDRAAVVRWAAAITRFAQGRGEVITARATQTAVVLATGSPPFLVAARRPGIPAGYLEMRAARAVDGLNGAAATSPPPRRGLEALAVEDRIAAAAHLLVSFGPVTPAAFAHRGTPIYVFGRREGDAAMLAARALDLCEALGEGGKLGRLVSLTVRRGMEWTVVRPLAGGTAVLAATGPVTRPGRAHREAERAAAMLESC